MDHARNAQALKADPNPFATLVLAHLKTLETRRAPADRRAWKLRLVKGLYKRGMSAKDVWQLFQFIDWVMDLPKPLAKLFWQEMTQYQEEKRMPFITTPERIGMEKGLEEGLLAGIEVSLEVKFGEEGLKLMPEIRALQNHDLLRAVLEAIKTASSPDELRRGRGRRAKKGRRA